MSDLQDVLKSIDELTPDEIEKVYNAHSALSKLLSAGLIRVTMAHIYNYNCYRVAKVSNEIL